MCLDLGFEQGKEDEGEKIGEGNVQETQGFFFFFFGDENEKKMNADRLLAQQH